MRDVAPSGRVWLSDTDIGGLNCKRASPSKRTGKIVGFAHSLVASGLLRRPYSLKLKIQRELDSPRANGHEWLQRAGQGDGPRPKTGLICAMFARLKRLKASATISIFPSASHASPSWFGFR